MLHVLHAVILPVCIPLSKILDPLLLINICLSKIFSCYSITCCMNLSTCPPCAVSFIHTRWCFNNNVYPSDSVKNNPFNNTSLQHIQNHISTIWHVMSYAGRVNIYLLCLLLRPPFVPISFSTAFI